MTATGSSKDAAWHAARLQVSLWLNRALRTAEGVWHERPPTVRRGQWVRFVGNPGVVQTPAGRPPRRGACGQVLRRWPDGVGLTVVFAGAKSFANLRADDVEPLVGTPPGHPRDHLRRFRRRMKARLRADEAARAQEQVGSGAEPLDR